MKTKEQKIRQAHQYKVGQRDRVYNTMLSGRWLTLGAIREKTGDAEASISAQLRHLRKEKHGSHIIEKRINVQRYNDNYLWEYKLQRKAVSILEWSSSRFDLEKKITITLEKQLDEIYEAIAGDNGRERFTHKELIKVILDLKKDTTTTSLSSHNNMRPFSNRNPI